MEEVRPIELGSFPLAVYGAMFGGTVAGQFAGVALDSAVGRRALWVPLADAVGLLRTLIGDRVEALVGARFVASRLSRTMTSGDWGRLSAYYSLLLALISAPLALWTAASLSPQAPLGGHAPSEVLALGFGALLAITLVRWGLMTVLAPRRAS